MLSKPGSVGVSVVDSHQVSQSKNTSVAGATVVKTGRLVSRPLTFQLVRVKAGPAPPYVVFEAGRDVGVPTGAAAATAADDVGEGAGVGRVYASPLIMSFSALK